MDHSEISDIRQDLRENNRVNQTLTEKISSATTLLGESIRQNDRRDQEYRDLFKRLADHDDEQRSSLAELKSQVSRIAEDQTEIRTDQTKLKTEVDGIRQHVSDAKLIFNFSRRTVAIIIGVSGTAIASIAWIVNHIPQILSAIK